MSLRDLMSCFDTVKGSSCPCKIRMNELLSFDSVQETSWSILTSLQLQWYRPSIRRPNTRKFGLFLITSRSDFIRSFDIVMTNPFSSFSVKTCPSWTYGLSTEHPLISSLLERIPSTCFSDINPQISLWDIISIKFDMIFSFRSLLLLTVIWQIFFMLLPTNSQLMNRRNRRCHLTEFFIRIFFFTVISVNMYAETNNWTERGWFLASIMKSFY